MILSEKLTIHPRLPVKAVRPRRRDKPHQIGIARFVFAQQHQMVILVIDPMLSVVPRARRHIRLTAENRLDPRFFGGFIKLHQPVHDPVIRYGNRRLPQLLDTCDQPVQTAGAVQQAVFTMNVQVCKRHGDALLY